tara:strand:- start:652 stop:993 length:342 start_codon:yes stop_codon:yes gene_type:complete
MEEKSKESVIIHNLKNSGFRQIHVDGAQGGLTPSGKFNLNFYAERMVIPKGTEFEINENGTLGDQIRHVDGSKKGIVREFEFGIYMSLEACESLKNFLDKKIEEIRSSTSETK